MENPSEMSLDKRAVEPSHNVCLFSLPRQQGRDSLLLQAGSTEQPQNVSKSIHYTETLVEGGEEETVSTRLLPSSLRQIEPKEKNIKCDFCSYATHRKSHLNEHYRNIHLKVKVICDLCGKEFSNINQHMRVVHKVLRSGIVAKKECQECGKEFFDLTKHMAKAHNLKYIYDYNCDLCETKFKSKFILQRHMQRRHGDKASCSECGKKVSNLDVHIKKVHGTREKREPSSCSFCDRTFQTAGYLSRHIRSCKEKLVGVTQVVMVVEPLIFEDNDNNGNMDENDNTGDMNHTDDVDNADDIDNIKECVKMENEEKETETDQTKEDVKPIPEEDYVEDFDPAHAEDTNVSSAVPISQNFMNCVGSVKLDQNSEEVVVKAKKSKTTMFQCELCGYATTRQTNYNTHYKMVHLKSRTMCELCGKEYSNINQHMKVVHKILKSGMTVKHKCEHCHLEYYDLDQHMRRAHPAMYTPRDRTCNVCGEKFTKFANLRRHHQRVHEGVKVSCEICQKRVSNIDKHRKVHKAREQPNNPNFQEDVVKEL